MCSDDNSIESLDNSIILYYYKINMCMFVCMPDIVPLTSARKHINRSFIFCKPFERYEVLVSLSFS